MRIIRPLFGHFRVSRSAGRPAARKLVWFFQQEVQKITTRTRGDGVQQSSICAYVYVYKRMRRRKAYGRPGTNAHANRHGRETGFRTWIFVGRKRRFMERV